MTMPALCPNRCLPQTMRPSAKKRGGGGSGDSGTESPPMPMPSASSPSQRMGRFGTGVGIALAAADLGLPVGQRGLATDRAVFDRQQAVDDRGGQEAAGRESEGEER